MLLDKIPERGRSWFRNKARASFSGVAPAKSRVGSSILGLIFQGFPAPIPH